LYCAPQFIRDHIWRGRETDFEREFVVIGPMARSVADLSLLLDAIADAWPSLTPARCVRAPLASRPAYAPSSADHRADLGRAHCRAEQGYDLR
jgi:Asp-tRNA(Asn)/Glu-tRNA(Gln) amidotransferase A subunit family amidase